MEHQQQRGTIIASSSSSTLSFQLALSVSSFLKGLLESTKLKLDEEEAMLLSSLPLSDTEVSLIELIYSYIEKSTTTNPLPPIPTPTLMLTSDPSITATTTTSPFSTSMIDHGLMSSPRPPCKNPNRIFKTFSGDNELLHPTVYHQLVQRNVGKDDLVFVKCATAATVSPGPDNLLKLFNETVLDDGVVEEEEVVVVKSDTLLATSNTTVLTALKSGVEETSTSAAAAVESSATKRHSIHTRTLKKNIFSRFFKGFPKKFAQLFKRKPKFFSGNKKAIVVAGGVGGGGTVVCATEQEDRQIEISAPIATTPAFFVQHCLSPEALASNLCLLEIDRMAQINPTDVIKVSEWMHSPEWLALRYKDGNTSDILDTWALWLTKITACEHDAEIMPLSKVVHVNGSHDGGDELGCNTVRRWLKQFECVSEIIFRFGSLNNTKPPIPFRFAS